MSTTRIGPSSASIIPTLGDDQSHDTSPQLERTSTISKILPNGTTKYIHDRLSQAKISATERLHKKSTRITLLVIFTLFALLITCIIWFYVSPQSFSTSNSTNPFVDGMYYYTTTISTVGYGDVLPVSVKAKLFTSFLQVLTTLISLGVVFKITDGRLKKAFGSLQAKTNAIQTRMRGSVGSVDDGST